MQLLSASHQHVTARLRAAGSVFAEDEAELLITSAPTRGALESWVRRRAAGEPLEYILGWAEFAGLRIRVDVGVFVPRRRTELLARLAACLATRGQVVVDLCCGTGAVAVAVAVAVPDIELHLADIDRAAVRCARRNVCAHALRAFVHLGDLYDALPQVLRGRVDLLAVNSPYVPTSQIRLLPPEARDHEPTLALDGGDDGLDVQRRVIAGARSWLAPGGHLLIQTSSHQEQRTREAVAASGLHPQVWRDRHLDATVIDGQRLPRGAGTRTRLPALPSACDVQQGTTATA